VAAPVASTTPAAGSAAAAEPSPLDDLVEPGTQVEQLAGGFQHLGVPVWVKEGGYLLFSDIPADVRLRWSEADGVVEVLRPANKCNGMTLDADGNLLVCEHTTFEVVRVQLAPDGTEAGRETIASEYMGKPLNSPNDLVAAADGSIYFTDPSYGRNALFGTERPQDLPFQGVYRIPPGGGELELVADDFEQPNGICLSPDGSLLYVNDLPRAHVRVFDVQPDGSLASGRIFCEGIGPGTIEEGFPDGMKCDERGNLWVASGPLGVSVISPGADLLGTIELPDVATNLSWGGEAWKTLYVTGFGGLYRIPTLVAGGRQVYH
jgi:gluconolactonase